MLNIISYAKESGKTFEEKPFGDVDSLVLAQLSYLRYEELVGTPGAVDSREMQVKDLLHLEDGERLFRNVRAASQNKRFLKALEESRRFQNVALRHYAGSFDTDAEKQFSAITFLLDDGTAYLAFRGTDATVVGWKEDLNMAFMPVVPSQVDGVAYVNSVAEKVDGKLRIGGHSKGGNIAVYAASHCAPDVQARVEHAYSHDGPGFRDTFFETDGFQSIKARIRKTVPESSIIGMLMQQQEDYTVVKSMQVGILQHDPFSWLVINGSFDSVKAIHKSAVFMDSTLNQWAETIDDVKRGLFINTLYEIIRVTNARTIDDLSIGLVKNAPAILDAVKGMDPDTRQFLLYTVKSLFPLAARNIAGMLQISPKPERTEPEA